MWGLDDYSFLSYVFGSAQLRGESRASGLVLGLARRLGALLADAAYLCACRPEGDPGERGAAAVAPADEPVLHVDYAHPRGQVGPVPRALVAAVRDRHWGAALEQGALRAVQDVRGALRCDVRVPASLPF